MTFAEWWNNHRTNDAYFAAFEAWQAAQAAEAEQLKTERDEAQRQLELSIQLHRVELGDSEKKRKAAEQECASLRERLQCAEVEQEKLQRDVRDRDGWIFLYNQSSDRIGKALESIRQKRWTGESARSDADEVADLVHRLQQCEADAARYRWLKTHCSVATLTVTPDTGIHLTDAAIDAALNTEMKR